MKNQVVKIFSSAILLVGGVLFIAMGAKNLSDINSFSEVSAVVTEVQVETSIDADGEETVNETVYVDYTVDGKEYNEILQFASGSYEKGDTVTVLYDPQKPEYVTGATKKTSMISIGAGILFALGGIGTFLRPFILVFMADKKTS